MLVLVTFLSILCFGGEPDQSWHHYGSLPSNTVLIKLKTKPAQRPVEIVGTATPASLTVEGVTKTLKKVSRIKSGFGVWVNNQSVTVEAGIGRFFTEYRAKNEDESRITILIQNSDGAFTYTHDTYRTFLDFPITLEQELVGVDSKAKEFTWTLSGKHQGVEFQIAKAAVETTGDTVTVKKSSADGENVLTGRIRHPQAGQRILHVPYEVSVQKPKPGEIILTLEESWEEIGKITTAGKTIRGFSNAGADIVVSGKKAKATSSGEWHVRLEPQAAAWESGLSVVWTKKRFHKNISFKCDDCSKEYFDDSWDLSINHGASSWDGEPLRTVGLAATKKNGVRFGLRTIYVFPKNRTNASFDYWADDFFLGYQFSRKAFPGPVWFEGGIFSRHRSIMDGRLGFTGRESKQTAGFYMRSEPLRWWKICGAGVQWDLADRDRGQLWAFAALHYSF